MYDIAIIGAGIHGCSIAHELTQANKKVLLIDEKGIASGGSGAAGAFISPKFSKSGDLKELLHKAFVYSMEFYEKSFPELFTKTQLIHIAKDESEDKTLKIYKQKTSLKLLDSIPYKQRETVSIESGIVDAKKMCLALAKSANFKKLKVTSLVFDENFWIINESYSAKELVLATGAYESLIPEPYIKLRGVWGHRIDIKTTTHNPFSLHQFVSISPTKNNIIAIGATHNVHYHPQKTKVPYNIQEGRAELLQKASQTLNLKNIEILQDYVGLRSGSFDYMPLLGPLVLSQETLQNKDINFKVKKADYSQYSYYTNLTIINGSGGYGFVLAPYLAKKLCEYILKGSEIDKELSPSRFFSRFAKKQT